MSGKKPAVSWKIAADRAVIGEKIELKSLPGYWVRPRRWTKAGEAEINAASARILAKQSAVRRSIMEQSSVPQSEADAAAGAIPEDVRTKIMDALTANLDGETVGQIESKIAKIAYGVHAHNFLGEEAGGTMEWARELAGYTDVFDEILGIVEAKNAPLALKTSP